MNPHYQYFLAANGELDGKPSSSPISKPSVSPIDKPYTSVGEEKPMVMPRPEAPSITPRPTAPSTGTATQYKTCWAGCPDTEAVSVAISSSKKLLQSQCPSSHPYSVKPSCDGGAGLLDGASTRPTSGGGGGGGLGGGSGSNGKTPPKKTWIPLILIGVGVFFIIKKPLK